MDKGIAGTVSTSKQLPYRETATTAWFHIQALYHTRNSIFAHTQNYNVKFCLYTDTKYL